VPICGAPWQGHWITSPAQTAIDLAGILTFMKAVIALDQAPWAKRSGGALTDVAALRSVAVRAPMRAAARVLSGIDFATPLSDSVRGENLWRASRKQPREATGGGML